jgi:transposase InsO family protein
VITDRLRKGSILLPVHPDRFDAKSIALLFIQRYVPFHWIPKAIVSDRGTQFVNALWARMCQLLNINQRLSTAYHPETNGAIERRNQEVETYLRAFIAYNQAD